MGMPLALVAAAPARGHASFQERPGDGRVVLAQSADGTHGRGADIGAVQAQPDALHHAGEVLFAEVGVGIGGTSPGTVAERLDGGGENAGVDIEVTLLGIEHLPGVAHGILRGPAASTDQQTEPVCRRAMRSGLVRPFRDSRHRRRHRVDPPARAADRAS
jgi:hypothetical protein